MADIEHGAHGGARPNTGGARTGAGRPRKDGDPTELQAANLTFARERAEHERVKREQRELQLKIDSGRYIDRIAVQQASATALAALAQAMRSIPDNLERKGISADVCIKVEEAIDEALGAHAESMRLFASNPD